MAHVENDVARTEFLDHLPQPQPELGHGLGPARGEIVHLHIDARAPAVAT
jgi:hypothetical protein